jgi:hypothetical protein
MRVAVIDAEVVVVSVPWGAISAALIPPAPPYG